ncbi:hypothetical protein CLV63_1104 [Murinocardiopsis flavida]|uniref:Uncharacterized protein n=1 Tax=Murinocardiopsis flavida TaxID=645275 RepID=A0A2P8DHM8_9ACTN|nr:hypothetical protein [Murinocardiopsis flavida]PSK96708.1 hypothetical protein CLV63_1104 [Murinocardiopsis flavida]
MTVYERVGGAAGSGRAPRYGAMVALAVVGALWVVVPSLGHMGLVWLLDRPYVREIGDVSMVVAGVLVLAAPLMLAAVWPLRRLGVRRPWAVAAAGLPLAGSAVGTAGFVLMGLVPFGLRQVLEPVLVLVLLPLACAAAFCGVVIRAALGGRLRAVAAVSGLVLAASLVWVPATAAVENRAEARADFEALGAVAVLDDPEWRRMSVATGGGDELTVTYRHARDSDRVLALETGEGAAAEGLDDPCGGYDAEVTCERKGRYTVRTMDSGPQLIAARGGDSYTVVAAPTWLPDARTADLLDAAAHLRAPTRGERAALREEALSKAVWDTFPVTAGS